jgi:hypothetical protein
VAEATSPDFYGEVFAALARPLTTADQVPEDLITANEQRLGVRLPEALRCYYAIAGNMRRLNNAYNRLLPPASWRLDRRVLVFLSENQGVVKWGVPARKARQVDSTVLYTVYDGQGEHSDWAPEELVCSDFLVLMLCWQAVHGGLAHTGWASVDQAVGEAVARCLGPAWQSRDLLASYRAGQVVCVAGRGGRLDVLAAGRSKEEFEALLRELAGFGINLEVQSGG